MNTPKLTAKELKALYFIKDEIDYRGRSPSYRQIKEHIGFGSPRSAYVLVDRLIEKGFLNKTPKGSFTIAKAFGDERSERTVPIPLVGSAPCGLPLLAEENIEVMIPVSQRIARPGARYFLLRAIGNSMDQAGIDNGDLVLVRQQPIANEGERIVALIDDEATIKEFHHKGTKVVLKPRSSNPQHQPIILDQEFMIQGVVIDTIPNPLE